VKQNFASSLAAVLLHEGGYVNDRLDPGGATNQGVTQRVYDDWRRSRGLAPRAVRSIQSNEVSAIYRKLYWDAVRGDDLPGGVDYFTFDFAVNSGVNRAIRYLQRSVGATEDGQLGPKTLAAVKAANAAEIVSEMAVSRQAFLEQLPTFGHFGIGWIRRVKEVSAACQGLCA
jgi:lysozyme family protein